MKCAWLCSVKDKQIEGSVMGLHFKGRGKVRGTQYCTCKTAQLSSFREQSKIL